MLALPVRRVLSTLLAASAVLAAGAARADAAAIPPPQQFFGFQPGTTGKLARFSKMEDYFRLIADKSNRVNFESIGTTTLGHDFPLMQISSPRTSPTSTRSSPTTTGSRTRAG